MGAYFYAACGFGAVLGLALGLGVFDSGESTAASSVNPPVLPGAEPEPLRVGRSKPRSATYTADQYGQFWIEGTANGNAFRFLVDTGASDIVFNLRDARRLGIDVKRLTFGGWVSTVNGAVRTASTRIATLTVGPFTATDVQVSVLEGDLGFPLLGMAFLKRLNVSIVNGTLTLHGEP